MFRLIAMIFGLPWPVLVVLACGLLGVGQYAKQQATAFEAEKAQALIEGQPEPVPLDDFDAEDVHLADEVHVTTWINVEHNYELTKQKRGSDTVRRMFVLFGPGDGMDSTVARGVVVIPPESLDAFLEVMLAGAVGEDEGKLLFNLNGKRESSPDLSDMVNDALDDQGLHKATEFLVVEPYLQGREEALKPDPGAPSRGMQIFGTIAALLLVVALKNFATGRRKPEPARSLADVVIPPVGTPIHPFGAAPSPAVAAAAPVPPPSQSEGWSPLEAVRARQEARVAAVSMPSAPSPKVETPKESGGLFGSRSDGRRLGTVPKIAGALALYFVVYLVAAPFTGPTQMSGVSEDSILGTFMAGTFGTEEGTEAPVAEAVAAAPSESGVADAPEAAGWVWPDGMSGLPPAVAMTGMAGGGLLLVALGLGVVMLLRRSGGGAGRAGARRAGAGRAGDPWDRLSERLR